MADGGQNWLQAERWQEQPQKILDNQCTVGNQYMFYSKLRILKVWGQLKLYFLKPWSCVLRAALLSAWPWQQTQTTSPGGLTAKYPAKQTGAIYMDFEQTCRSHYGPQDLGPCWVEIFFFFAFFLDLPPIFFYLKPPPPPPPKKWPFCPFWYRCGIFIFHMSHNPKKGQSPKLATQKNGTVQNLPSLNAPKGVTSSGLIIFLDSGT